VTPPRNAVQRRGGGRFYPYPLHAEADEQMEYPSSTSATGMWPKPWAMPWASKMAAERAVELHKSGALSALLEQGDNIALDAIKSAFRHARDDAAIAGSKVHEAWEEYLKDLSKKPDDIRSTLSELAASMFDGLLALTEKYNVEWLRSEQTAYNHDHHYAGTFDGIVLMDTPSGVQKLLVDIKTSKSPTRDEYAAQLASYRYATHIIHADGTEEVMPEVDGCIIFHVRPDGAHAIPVNTDRVVFDSFLACLAMLRATHGKEQLFGPPLPEPDDDNKNLSQRKADK
jgi:hypothetical protein